MTTHFLPPQASRVLCFCGWLFLSLLPGCTGSSLTGGQARHETGELNITYDGVVIRDSREIISTTQPSGTTSGPGKLNAGKAEEGSFGTLDITLDQIKGRNLVASLIVAALFLGIGALLWFTGQPVLAVLIGIGGAAAAIMFPWILAGVLVLGIAYAIWSVYRMRNQLVAGTSNALAVAAKINPTLPEKLKVAMETEHDSATKSAIAAALPKQNKSDQVEVEAIAK